MSHPFEEEVITDSVANRYFSDSVDEEELVWHRDAESRVVYVVASNGTWKYQMDNDIPRVLTKNLTIHIEKEQWHRLIKGTGMLCLRIHKISSSDQD